MLQDARDEAPATEVMGEGAVRRIVLEEIARALKSDQGAKHTAIIASKGTLDWAYPPLILATTSGALGMQTALFFTFYGLNIVHKDHNKLLKVGPTGGPAMPMPMPMPQLLTAMPGMVPLATSMMKSKFQKRNVATSTSYSKPPTSRTLL